MVGGIKEKRNKEKKGKNKYGHRRGKGYKILLSLMPATELINLKVCDKNKNLVNKKQDICHKKKYHDTNYNKFVSKKLILTANRKFCVTKKIIEASPAILVTQNIIKSVTKPISIMSQKNDFSTKTLKSVSLKIRALPHSNRQQ